MLPFPATPLTEPIQKLVQDKLYKLGYTSIKQFQTDHHLKADGIVGPLTWGRIFTTNTEVTPTSRLLRNRAVEIARTQLFVREKTGHNDGTEIKAYLHSVGLPEGYSWCQAFVYWCYDQAALAIGTTNPVTHTAGVLKHWHDTKGLKLPGDKALAGDIFIMDFGNGEGHTGLVSEVRIDKITTIEGNTNTDGSRNGNGVYERLRSINTIKGFIRYNQ